MNKKDKNKTILTIISTSAARKPNLKLPIPPTTGSANLHFPPPTPNATRSVSERNLIGFRTQPDRTPNAKR